ncbi:25128_t:CDS:1, partial [Gigaspora margarita]
MTTDKALIRQDLLATEPLFVIFAPCFYDEIQVIVLQLAFTHNE